MVSMPAGNYDSDDENFHMGAPYSNELTLSGKPPAAIKDKNDNDFVFLENMHKGFGTEPTKAQLAGLRNHLGRASAETKDKFYKKYEQYKKEPKSASKPASTPAATPAPAHAAANTTVGVHVGAGHGGGRKGRAQRRKEAAAQKKKAGNDRISQSKVEKQMEQGIMAFFAMVKSIRKIYVKIIQRYRRDVANNVFKDTPESREHFIAEYTYKNSQFQIKENMLMSGFIMGMVNVDSTSSEISDTLVKLVKSCSDDVKKNEALEKNSKATTEAKKEQLIEYHEKLLDTFLLPPTPGADAVEDEPGTDDEDSVAEKNKPDLVESSSDQLNNAARARNGKSQDVKSVPPLTDITNKPNKNQRV